MYATATLFLVAALQVSARIQPLHERFELYRKAGAEAGVLAGAPVNDITVNAYNVNQCGQATITWTGTTAPVSVKIGQGGFYVGITEITTLDELYDDYTMWTVDQAQGEDLVFQVTDANGEVGYVQNVNVGEGDGWCLEAGSAGSADSATVTSEYVAESTASSAASLVAGGDATVTPAALSIVSTSSSKPKSPSTSTASTLKASAIGADPRVSTSVPTTTITQDDTAAIVTSASGSSRSKSVKSHSVTSSTSSTSSRQSVSGSAGASAGLAGANSVAQTGFAGRNQIGYATAGLLGSLVFASLLL